MGGEDVAGEISHFGAWVCERFYVKKESNQHLSGNGIYYSSCPFLIILKNSCSRLNRQKDLKLIHIFI